MHSRISIGQSDRPVGIPFAEFVVWDFIARLLHRGIYYNGGGGSFVVASTTTTAGRVPG